MGVPARKSESRSQRRGYALPSRIRCTPYDYSRSMPMSSSPTTPKPSSPPATPRPSVISLLDKGEEGLYVQTNGTVLKVPKALFDSMSPEIQHTLPLTTGNGLSIDDPILLRPPMTTLQLRYLVHAFRKHPSLDITKLPIEQLFSIAELALHFGLTQLQRWSVESITAILNSPQTPLRTGNTEIFIRGLRIALVYGQSSLSNSIQAKWLTRLHWRELPPLPAILFADRHGLRNLLCHAYYIHMVEVTEARIQSSTNDTLGPIDIAEYCRTAPSSSSPLTLAHRTHLLAGNYSLGAHWRRLRISPPSFSHDHQCANNDQCLAVWKLRWITACSQQCPTGVPEMDILRRLKWVEDWLRRDQLTTTCMYDGCRDSAVGSIAKIRDELVRNLGHHFDLG